MRFGRKARAWALAAGVFILLLFVWLGGRWMKPRERREGTVTGPPPTHLAPPPAPCPGEMILREYAMPTSRVEDDLGMMAHMLANFTLLVKSRDAMRLGANGEIAAALRGANPARLMFLPPAHRAFNSAGELIDRWQTPLYFHALARDRIDIRSAGPDRKLWTEDDVHRRHDGQFLVGGALDSDSLHGGKRASGGGGR